MSEKQIEQMKRKKILNKKMAIASVIYLVAIASTFALKYIPPVLLNAGVPNMSVETVSTILKGIGGFGSIWGVCAFAKSLHDPLTEKEARELEEKDAIEKGGYKK